MVGVSCCHWWCQRRLCLDGLHGKRSRRRRNLSAMVISLSSVIALDGRVGNPGDLMVGVPCRHLVSKEAVLGRSVWGKAVKLDGDVDISSFDCIGC